MNHPGKFLTGPQVRERYGISDMTLWRWIKDQQLMFAQPRTIRRRRYFSESELDDFDRRQAQASRESAA